jgi:hypothetical protein
LDLVYDGAGDVFESDGVGFPAKLQFSEDTTVSASASVGGIEESDPSPIGVQPVWFVQRVEFLAHLAGEHAAGSESARHAAHVHHGKPTESVP